MNSTAQWLLWLVIFIVIIVCYAFRFELDYAFQRVLAVLIPSHSWSKNGELIISRNQDGHFYTEALINGTKIKFLIDTGASDVALTAEDARLLRYDLSRLKYSRHYSTANGTVTAAPITLQNLQIGPKIFYDVPAHIASGNNELDISLLGMSAISRFKSFKIDKDLLILSY